jgi:hypothetical protein
LPLITLADAGLPANVTGSLSVASGSAAGFSSKLTISTANAAATPGVTVTITGSDSRIPEGGARGTTVTLVVLTAARALALVIYQVNPLNSAQALNDGQANSLIVKLDHAIASLTSNQADNPSVCNELSAFVNEVSGYLAVHILSPTQASLLLGGPLGINAIMAAIPCS